MKFDILRLLPPTNSDPAQDRWQRAITAALLLTIATLAASTSSLGAGVYWSQKETATLRHDISDLKHEFAQMIEDSTNRLDAGRIKGNIIAMQTRYCDAVRARNIPLAESINATISELQADYARIMGNIFPVRACA